MPAWSSFTFGEPCTLWHDEHVSLPSRTGMWLKRSCLLTLRWQVAQSVYSFFAFSSGWPFGEWTLWQFRQPDSAVRAGCRPTARVSARLWQVVHVALAWSGDRLFRLTIVSGSPSVSTCFLAGPWHDSQP